VRAGTLAPAVNRPVLLTLSVKGPAGAVIVPPGAKSATQFVQVIVSPAGTVTDCPGPAVICAAAGGAAMVANSGTIRTAQTAEAGGEWKKVLWERRGTGVFGKFIPCRRPCPRTPKKVPHGSPPFRVSPVCLPPNALLSSPGDNCRPYTLSESRVGAHSRELSILRTCCKNATRW